MTTYTPPVDDIRFVMHQVADLAGILATERFAHVDADTVDAVVEEVGRFMAEEVAPTNVDGDRIGSNWQPDGTASVKYRGAQWSVIVRDGVHPTPGPHRVAELIGNRLLVDKA